MSFDVFGAWRDAQSWAIKHAEASSGLLSSAITLKGYTGHEQIDDVGLVHMGGRVYDPILGRFLQAAPFICNIPKPLCYRGIVTQTLLQCQL